MKNIYLKLQLLLLALGAAGFLQAQPGLFDLDVIQKIEIHFDNPDWDYMLDTAKLGANQYSMADWVKINGVFFDSVGVKYKGSSSYDSSFKKNPFHIKLKKFKSHNYQGYTDLKLANGYGDPSMIREVLSYHILGNYMACPKSNFAEVYVNDEYIGLYTNDEPVNKKFVSDNFYSSKNTFIKCSPELPGPASKCNLAYLSDDSTAYYGHYEMESDYGWKDLIGICSMLANEPEKVAEVFDLDKVLWMLAFNNIMVDLDSYSGWFSQNYYLYKGSHGLFNVISWDMNMSLGGFPFAGGANGSSGSLTIPNMQQLPPFLHQNDADWPLIKAVLANPQYRRMYMAHFCTIAFDFIVNGKYKQMAHLLQGMIDNAVKADHNKFFTYEQFISGLTDNVQSGSYFIPGISVLLDGRATWLQNEPEFKKVPPAIDEITVVNEHPHIGENAVVNVAVSGNGDKDVYLAYRYGITERFTRVRMFDDGQHDDGVAGDNVFGASFPMTGPEAHCYIYAENSDAGIFSPANAEHVFYTITAASLELPAPGEVVINEFLAKNEEAETNEYGTHEDWIELYNNTDRAIDLYGLYLSDNFKKPKKFAFPEGSIIEPHSFLPLWADDQPSTSQYIHVSFKLSADGEELILSDGEGYVVDSLTFGPQQPDVSMGRCPDGVGEFRFIDEPTFGAPNTCPVGIPESKSDNIRIYPNPASTGILVKNLLGTGITVQLFNCLGTVVFSDEAAVVARTIDVSGLANGLYILKIMDASGRIIRVEKVVISK